MGSYKHIETCIGEYIAKNYINAVEVGIGENTEAARILLDAGARVRCTDVKDNAGPEWLCFISMMYFHRISPCTGSRCHLRDPPCHRNDPPAARACRKIDCDLIVYHLGFESYGNGGEKIDCGVVLHRYYKASEPVKQR